MLLLPLQKYVQTPNLAEYLGLRPVDALHMSVPINAIFIGFQGDGNSKVRVNEMCHRMRHVMVSKLSAQLCVMHVTTGPPARPWLWSFQYMLWQGASAAPLTKPMPSME